MTDKKLSGKRVLMVIAPNQFRDEELIEPKKVFLEEGAEVTVAACKPGEAKGMLGASVKPDLLVCDAKAENFDALVVVGGMGSPTYLWGDDDLHNLAQSLERENKVVAAICLSGAALANAGVLRGRRATVYATPDSVKALEAGGAEYVQEHVVQDGLIITADGPDAARDFGLAVAKAMTSTVVTTK